MAAIAGHFYIGLQWENNYF